MPLWPNSSLQYETQFSVPELGFVFNSIEMREGLKNFYSVLKGADEFIKFCLLTGVSKFSKVSLFSGLNNLRDITLISEYSAICGYTDYDIDKVFAVELPGLNRTDIQR